MSGGVAEGFGAVVDAFTGNFDAPGEDAAAVAVVHGGVQVVDLWGGEDVIRGQTMQPNALMMVASCSKGITATVLAILVDRGVLDPERRVAELWPGFAAAGKQDITIGMVASHTAGLPFPPLGTGLQGLDMHRGEAVTRALAAAAPLWRPGTAMAYHPVTYGTLLDEIVRRATGHSIGHHVGRLLREPLALDMWIGLPCALVDRVVPGRWEGTDPMQPPQDTEPPGSYTELRRRALEENPPTDPDFADPDDVGAYYAAERPAVGAITDARAVATMYAALLNPVEGVRLIDDHTLHAVTAPRTDDVKTLIESGTAGPDIRFGLGYQLSSPSMPGLTPSSFGHTGAGGRLGIADPTLDIGFGYICSRMRNIGAAGDPRWRSLLDALHRCLD